jgi:hypothetical protein
MVGLQQNPIQYNILVKRWAQSRGWKWQFQLYLPSVICNIRLIYFFPLVSFVVRYVLLYISIEDTSHILIFFICRRKLLYMWVVCFLTSVLMVKVTSYVYLNMYFPVYRVYIVACRMADPIVFLKP